MASRFKIEDVNLSPLPTRDCFLPIFAVLASAAKAKVSLSTLANNYFLPVAISDRLENCSIEASAKLMGRLITSRSAQDNFFAPLGKIDSRNTIDGLRVKFADGKVVHLRPSGNAPEFRCYVEASNQSAAAALLKRALEAVAAEL